MQDIAHLVFQYNINKKHSQVSEYLHSYAVKHWSQSLHTIMLLLYKHNRARSINAQFGFQF